MKLKRQKKILITGGAGFIGSSIVLQLENTYDITCLGRGKGFSKLKQFTNKNVSFVVGDINDEALLDKQVKTADSIIHLVGGGGNALCIKDPLWALNTHIRGTSILTKLATKHKVKKFVFASTYQLYGSSDNKQSIKETASLNPKSFYASLKSIAEKIIIDSGLNYSIVRLANVYGYSPIYTLQSAGAINNFIRACLDGTSIKINGTGKQYTDYIHIQDATNAIISILKKGSSKSIYNIGSGKLIRIHALTKIVQDVCKKLYNKNIQIKKIKRSDAMSQDVVQMSIQKVSKEFKWKPNISLETGIAELMAKNKAL